MASAARGKEKDTETLSPRAARAKLEEDLGKLDISGFAVVACDPHS